MGNLPEQNVTNTDAYGNGLIDRKGRESINFQNCANMGGLNMEPLGYYRNGFNHSEGMKGTVEAHTDICKARQMGDYETDEYDYEYTSQGNSSGSEAKILYQSGEVFTKAEESCNEKSESQNNLNRNICEKSKFTRTRNDGNTITWIGDSTQPFECDVCRKRFCTWFGLNKHAMTTHDADINNERRFQCAFHRKGNTLGLKRNSNFNSESEPLVSDESQKIIPQNAPAQNFRQQLQHCQNKNVNKTFKQLPMNSSMNYPPAHPNATFYQCDLCGRCFRHKSEFKLHMMGHLKDQLSKNKAGGEIVPAKRPQNVTRHMRPDFVKCEKCAKVFDGVKKFKQHLGWALQENVPPWEAYDDRYSRGYELTQPSKIVPTTYFTYEQPVNAFSERRLLPVNTLWARNNRCANYSGQNSVNSHQHFLLSSPNLAKCKHCGRAHSANVHQHAQHRSLRTCSKCGKSFTRLNRMRRRQRLQLNPTRFKYLQAGNQYQQPGPPMNYPMGQVDNPHFQQDQPRKLPRLPTGLRRHKEINSDHPYCNYAPKYYPNFYKNF